MQRRITIGDALKRLAGDPDNDELAREVADLLERPAQETGNRNWVSASRTLIDLRSYQRKPSSGKPGKVKIYQWPGRP